MDIIIRVAAFAGTILSLIGAIYVLILDIKMKKMQKVNCRLDEYIKNEGFLKMKNSGEDPQETKKRFEMPIFSQDSDYIIRRKML